MQQQLELGHISNDLFVKLTKQYAKTMESIIRNEERTGQDLQHLKNEAWLKLQKEAKIIH